jgi:hypothetical protein
VLVHDRVEELPCLDDDAVRGGIAAAARGSSPLAVALIRSLAELGWLNDEDAVEPAPSISSWSSVRISRMRYSSPCQNVKPEVHGLRVLVDAIGWETLPVALPFTGVTVTFWLDVFHEGPPH